MILEEATKLEAGDILNPNVETWVVLNFEGTVIYNNNDFEKVLKFWKQNCDCSMDIQ